MKRIVSLAIVLAILLTALAFSEGMWTCTSCGSSGNTGNFCTNCGAKRQDESWTCPSCGTSGNVSNFCPNCGTRRPENTAVLAADANAEADWNVGDTVLFGSYEQDGDASGNSEPIEWLVLEVNDHDALLLSKKALVCHAYHDVNEEVTWESCTLRQWLNGSFMDSAFTAAERENILPSHVEDAPNPSFGTPAGNATEDYVYLLSIGEAERYLPEADDRFCVPTVCAMDDGPLTSSDYLSNGEMSCDWWLRSPGYSGNCAADVYVDGYIYAEGLPVDSLGCVRPVTRVCYPLNVKKTEEVKTSTPVPQVTIQPTLVPTATPAPTNTPTPQPTNAIGTGTNGYAIGDIVTFGTYPQTAEGNDDTPIEWIVLDKNGDEYLLISKMILDCQPYYPERVDDVAWENSTLRAWLNNEFYNKAFNASQKSQIVSTTIEAEGRPEYAEYSTRLSSDTIDKVFILGEYDNGKYYIWKYLTEDDGSICKATEYACSHCAESDVFVDESGNKYIEDMWLSFPYYSDLALFVECTYIFEGGYYDTSLYCTELNCKFGVRPCTWVRLGDATSSNSLAVSTATPAPKPTNTPKPTATPFGAGKLYIPSMKTIKEKPDSKSTIIGNGGGDFLYVSYENGWYRLLLSDGTYGYVEQSECQVRKLAMGDYGDRTTTDSKSTAAPKSTKNTYGTLKIDAGTNIRSGSSTNSSVVLTTVVSKTYKYVSCENGWYKIILDDGSYAYVYYTRAMVVSRAPGDDGSYGITTGGSGSSGSRSGSGGSSGGGSGSGNSSGSGGSSSGSGSNGKKTRGDVYVVTTYYCFGNDYHYVESYCMTWYDGYNDYMRGGSIDFGSKSHSYDSNGVCTMCGYKKNSGQYSDKEIITDKLPY